MTFVLGVLLSSFPSFLVQNHFCRSLKVLLKFLGYQERMKISKDITRGKVWCSEWKTEYKQNQQRLVYALCEDGLVEKMAFSR